MPGINDPSDPYYANEPGKYEFKNGQWVGRNGGGSEFWNDPNSQWSKDFAWGRGAGGTTADLEKGVDDAAVALGYAPKHVDPAAAGGALDTSQADEERNHLGVLLGQLQQQAATGGGAWEGSLADNTKKAQSSAMALGQSQPGVGYADALRNIGNAQGASSQRAVGQANILREQSKMGAQDQLTGLTGAMNDADANQSAATAAAQQGITELNASLAKNANGQQTKDTTSAGGMLSSLMSDGGEVPGKAKVFGDDSRNDTVPAKLSPGEIVIPRSHASSPEAAADFVRALQSQKPQHMADGGTAGSGLTGPDSGSAQTANDRAAGVASVLLPHVGAALRQPHMEGPSIQNGGMLNTAPYNQSRAASLANATNLQQRASGQGPSIAGQQMQNTTDDNIATAMQAGNRVSAGDVLQRTTAANQSAAGNAGATVANEQQSGQMQTARALASQRSRDLAYAQAQQQAAFRQTQMNAGLGLEQQAAMRGILAGAGQAAMAGSAAAGGKGDSYSGNNSNLNSFDEGDRGYDLANDEFSKYPGSSAADLHDPNDLWKGGKVKDTRAADFVKALRASR